MRDRTEDDRTPCSSRQETSKALTLLKQCHSFPGLFSFKLIGKNTSVFYNEVMSAVADEMGEMANSKASLSTRKSSGCRYLSLTLRLEMESAEQVLRLYARFSRVEGLRAMM